MDSVLEWNQLTDAQYWQDVEQKDVRDLQFLIRLIRNNLTILAYE